MFMKDLKTICAEKLGHLSNNITEKEKLEAQLSLPISRPTLDKYLKGDVIKIDTATQLIQFFTEKVNDRTRVLAETNLD